MTLTAVAPATRSRPERLAAPLATTAGLALATVALRLRDPHESGSWGFCPSALLGFSCPGCGGLRAVNDLTHGDLAAAASSNLLFVLAIPLAVFLLGRWVYDAWTGRARGPTVLTSRAVLVAAAVATATFTVLRNLPGSWLAP